jgi:hypothetical protein
MSVAAHEVVAEAFKEQGAAYPRAGARLVLAALTAAGYEIVELPKPKPVAWPVIWDDEPEDVYAKSTGDIAVSGVATMTSDQAHTLAAALLAAAKAAEAH